MKRIELNKINQIIDTIFDNVLNEENEEIDEIIGHIYQILCEMKSAGDGDIHYSIGNFGLSITKDYIDFVDIKSGTSLGTLIWA